MNGINVIGHVNGQFGLGKALRLNLKAMETAGINHKVFDYTTTPKETFLNFKYRINFIQISLNEIDNFLKTTPSAFFENKYSILFLVWESENVAPKFQEIINLFDEIWTASSYCKEVFQKFYNGPITVTPHPVEISVKNTSNKFVSEIYAENRLSFLYIFDFNSSAIRKNPFFLVNVFIEASKRLDNKIELILKTSNSEHHPKDFAKLQNQIKAFENIKLIDDRLSRNDLNNLLNNCNSYISLHHSEGFGLTIAEAMFLGKPTIATNYSGNTEYMNKSNSYLVDSLITPIENPDVHFDKNTIWSNPDFEDSIQKIIAVFLDSENTNIKGLEAKKYISDRLSYKSVGKLMLERIEVISKNYGTINNYQKQIYTLKNKLLVKESELLKKEKELIKIKKSKPIKFILKIKKWFRHLKK